MAKRIIDGIRRIIQQGTEVREGAQVTRALIAMLGDMPRKNLVDAIDMSQALLTDRVLQRRKAEPLPTSISRQINPEDPAFLPPLGAHLPLSARDVTLLGLPRSDKLIQVDPWGWCGGEVGPMVTVWYGTNQESFVIGDISGKDQNPSLEIEQCRSDDLHGIITKMKRYVSFFDEVSGTIKKTTLQIELFHWPIMIEGEIACALVSRVHSDCDLVLKMGITLTPMNMQGSAPIFHVRRDGKGCWYADGMPVFQVSQIGDGFITSNWKGLSLWEQFEKMNQKSFDLQKSPNSQSKCSVGQCAVSEVYFRNVRADQSWSHFSVLFPKTSIHTHLMRTSETNLWRGAIADRKGLMNAGSTIKVTHNQKLFDTLSYRLFLGIGSLATGESTRGDNNLALCLCSIALARLGFIQKSSEMLSKMLEQSSLDNATLAWAATEYILWTDDTSFLYHHQKQIVAIVDSLTQGNLQPSGNVFFGKKGSLRYSEIWRIAALLNATRVLRNNDEQRRRWGLAGAEGREQLLHFLGELPWRGIPDQKPDGSSVALLSAVWLRILSPEISEVTEMLSFLQKQMHDGGILLHGGAHIAAHAMYLAVKQLRRPEFDGSLELSKYASPAFTLPTARHKYRGALLQGDDLLSASLYILLVLDHIRLDSNTIEIGPAIRSVFHLPTPFGNIDFDSTQGISFGRWRKGKRNIQAFQMLQK